MAEAAPRDLLEVRQVSKAWPGAPEPVLAGLDLTVPAGALVVVEGANGAGKTTMLRVIAGLIEPDGGAVLVGGLTRGERPAEYQRRLGVAAAGQGNLFARLDARRHLQFSARLHHVARPLRPGRVDAAIADFRLGGFADRRVDRLSMGQRQRLRLALAFLHEPPVVLLDEPSNSLDEDGQELLLRATERHLAAGRCVVWLVPTGTPLPDLAHTHLRLAAGELTTA